MHTQCMSYFDMGVFCFQKGDWHTKEIANLKGFFRFFFFGGGGHACPRGGL